MKDIYHHFTCHFQQYFIYIMAVSFICEGNRSNVVSSTPCHEQDVNSS